MRLTRQRSLFIAMLLLGVSICRLSVASNTSGRLSVTIESTKTKFSVKDAIPIIITISNDSDSIVAVYPAFSPEPVREFPDTVLLFEIEAADGAAIGRDSSDLEHYKRKRVSRSDFREIPPGWFFGGPIYINRPPFGYKLSNPGVYRIRVRAIFNSGGWLRELGARDPGLLEKLSFASDFLADGSRSSNQLTIEIVP